MDYLIGNILLVCLELVVVLDGAMLRFIGSSGEILSGPFFTDILECMLCQMSFRKVPVLESCKTNVLL